PEIDHPLECSQSEVAMGRDLRRWIDEMDAADELLHVRKPVDPHTQMGALLYQSREKGLLFENVVGHEGWRVLGQAPANLRHAALAFDTDLQGLIPTVAKLMERRIEPELVPTGPVKDIVQTGEQVNLLDIPTHIAGARDAGSFLPFGLTLTRLPDTRYRNARLSESYLTVDITVRE